MLGCRFLPDSDFSQRKYLNRTNKDAVLVAGIWKSTIDGVGYQSEEILTSNAATLLDATVERKVE